MEKRSRSRQQVPRHHLKSEVFPEWFRQLDFFDPEEHDPRVTIIGAGGIGSPTAVLLAKLGVRRFVIYDPDTVVPHNLATTPFRHKDLGFSKVKALRKIIKESNPKAQVTVIPHRYKGGKLPQTDILISAVDSMAARKVIFKAAVAQKIPLFIDGRIGGENVRVYVIRPGKRKDRALYNASWKPDHKIPPLPCSRQQVVDVSARMSSHIVRAVRHWVVEHRLNPEIAEDLDILSSYVAPEISPRPLPPVGTETVEPSREIAVMTQEPDTATGNAAG